MKRWPYALFAAVTLAVFAPWIFEGQTLFAVGALTGATVDGPPRIADNILVLRRDLMTYNEGLKKGELRLWNPYSLCGIPATGDPMLHPFHPPVMLLHALLPVDPAFELTLLLHLFGAGAAMYVALAGWGRSRAAAALGGLVWMLWGYQAMWFSHATLLGVSVWGPLAAHWLSRGLREKSRRHAALAGVALGLCVLGSHPQYALLAGLALGIGWAVFLVRAAGERRFVFGAGLLVAIFAAGTGAAAILAWIDVISIGFRDPETTFELLYRASEGMTGFTSGLVGGHSYFPQNAFAGFEFFAHAGLAVTGLALAGMARGHRETSTRFLFILGIVAMLVAVVEPVARAVSAVPLLNLSPPSRWVYVFGACLAALASRGVDAAGERWAPRVGLVAAVVALVELLPIFLHFNEHAQPMRMVAPARPMEQYRFVPIFEGQVSSDDLNRKVAQMALLGRQTPSGFQALVPARYALFAGRAGAEIVPGGRGVHFVNLDSPLLGWAGITFDEEATIVAPLAHTLAIAWRASDPVTAADLLGSKGVLEGAPEVLPGKAGDVRWIERTSDRIVMEAEGPGVLIVADGYHPAWEADIDGQPAPIYPANVAFRGMLLPEGRHTITMRFRPASKREGLAVTALFLVAAVVIAFRPK